jgi:hypothetical protein
VGLHAAHLSWASSLAIVFAVDGTAAACMLMCLFLRRAHGDAASRLPQFLSSGAPLGPVVLDKLMRVWANAQRQQAAQGHQGAAGEEGQI